MRARTIRTLTFGASAALALALAPTDARAQAGVAQKALPNVLLLVDTSGSMERMIDDTLPVCNPGVVSSPNRWGILVQALTGNLQPFSCGAMSRATDSALHHEYQLGGNAPYDVDYFLPHHRILSGIGANACAVGPNKLPGGSGVGPSNATAGGFADAFPSDALRNVLWSDIVSKYGAVPGQSIPAINTCDFLQADDGQLDASRDYIRFSLMTFDQDLSPGIGVTSVDSGSVSAGNPFTGQWSYLRTSGNPFGYGFCPDGLSGKGAPAGCSTCSDFEVGARNWAAPPWEGRLVRFPDPLGSLGDVERTNDQVQSVITASRPYGATPIDAMLDDARDFLQKNPQGPGVNDPYVTSGATGCRSQFNILLTDGAPNLALRASCEPGRCPYPGAAPGGTRESIAGDIAKNMYDAPRRVTTFVIGFAVNGSSTTIPLNGFPAGFAAAEQNCTFWYNDATKGFNKSSSAMATYCTANPRPPGSTADACCQLNDIAFNGSGGTAPPYFADSQSQLVNAFGQVLAQVTQDVSTRTVPAYTATSSTPGGAASITGSFTAAFVPNPRKPWSGQLNRVREKCASTGTVTVPGDGGPGTPALAQGDYFDKDLAQQSQDQARLFFTVIGENAGTGADSFRTMRPFMDNSPDMVGVTVTKYQGQEAGKQDMGLLPALQTNGSPTLVPAMGIDDKTCKKSRDVFNNVIPALTATECSNVIWRFAAASKDISSVAGYPNFNVRCKGGSATCAATGVNCVSDAACNASNKGDVCVPACSALGAIFRSTPATASAPNSVFRDEGYRSFAEARKGRKAALFVATTDGILHGFKALDDSAGITGKHELWAFVPPAVLPKLASNYPGGQQILLDGSPVVKDVVWERDATQISEGKRWHTTLVAGIGSNGPGYYALNVTDVDCSSALCTDTTFQASSPGAGQKNTAAVSTGLLAGSAATIDNAGFKPGPHFLWQLTDIERTSEPAAIATVRKTKPVAQGGDNKEFVALFGKQTGTPAITTLLYKPDPASTTAKEIGVAILPGGIDGPPTSTTATCPRFGGTNLSDSALPARGSVRQWAPGCGPVAGRSVTIVRLDTGEIVRHFGRVADTPVAIASGPKFTAAGFDSPIVGVPVAFPSDVGTVATRAFVGDADGTIWRLDLSSSDPSQWSVALFQDLFSGGTATDGQPISVPPVASLDPIGNLVLNVATGEQENLVTTTAYNKVFSILEGKPLVGPVNAQVQWYTRLDQGERVTGPMAVFDGTLYFATYLPEQSGGGGVCANLARPYVWAVDYVRPANAAAIAQGGLRKDPPIPPTGAVIRTSLLPGSQGGYDYTNVSLGGTITIGNTLIPGLGVKQSLSCATDVGTGVTDYFGQKNYGVSAQSASQFTLEIPAAKAGASGVGKISVSVPTPRTPTSIDAWALAID